MPVIESKTITEQISILKSRNLKIEDVSFASSILERKNYYNIINAFKEPFLDTTYRRTSDSDPIEKYKDNTTFEELYSLYKFDIELRNLFLKYILIFENEFKTKVSICLSQSFHAAPYFNDNIYDKNKHDAWKEIPRIKDTIANIIKRKGNIMIDHFVDKGDLVPTWALFNTFDFGNIRTFYKYLCESVRIKVANLYGLNPKKLDTMLSDINMFRNVCAHNNRVYNYKINDYSKEISNTNIHSNMCIERYSSTNKYKSGKNDLFSVVICFRYLLSEEDFAEFFRCIDIAINQLNDIISVVNVDDILNMMGFPLHSASGQKDWKDILTIAK